MINAINRHSTEKPWLVKNTRRVLVALLLLALTMPGSAESGNESQSAIAAATKQKLAKVQIPFIANQGQANKETKFYARTFAGTVSVTAAGELVYSLPKVEDKRSVAVATLKEELVGGKAAEVNGESQSVTKLNYFKGNDRSKWQSNIPSYDVVNLGEVYDGIDFKLKAYGNNVEKLFYVKPGADPETIKIKLNGGKGIRVSESGELEVETEQGIVRFSKPMAFQEDGEKREFIEASYALRGNEYGFKVGDYDRTRELLIDPILAATFLGGSDYPDEVSALAFDSTGNVYVAGSTASSDFPGVGPGSVDSAFAGAEGFVAKLNPDLSSILAATFLGGSGGDFVSSLALDSMGNVYVAGGTESFDLPGVGPGSADNTFAGQFGGLRAEGFVAKLNSDLSSMLAASFLGGNNEDMIHTLALDSSGNVYVAGFTLSSDFPGVGPGSADRTFAGDEESFVAKLNSDLSSILAATFLGGNSSDWVFGVALDGTGNVYVAGATDSSDFPGVGPGSADRTFAVGNNQAYDVYDEGFVAKLSSDLGSILAATFLGGSGRDRVGALAIGSTGNVYAFGNTTSGDFPGVGPGSADTTFVGYGEAFVAKLSSDLSTIQAATFLGGTEDEVGFSLAIDSTGNVYVAGYTLSSDFPGIGPGSAYSTPAQGFVAKLNSDLSDILAATFLGGHGSPNIRLDLLNVVALDTSGNVYVAGQTYSGAFFPGVGPGSADSTFALNENGNGSEGFIAKLDANLSAGPLQEQVVNDLVNFVVQSTSLNPTPVPGGPAGVFTITARLTNTSTEDIHEPINAIVKTLTNENKLLSATEGNGGAGSKQAIDAGADNVLIPNESATVQFRIGLANRNRFSFFVDVSGIVNGDD